MSRLSALKAANSIHDVAALLNIRASTIAYILYIHPKETNYLTFQIPKRSGGQRTIHAPYKGLKELQRSLADLLQDCNQEILQASHSKDLVSHGFKRGRSIISNAQRHRRRRWVLNLDLESFFPSINFGRVYGLLQKHRDFALAPKVATIIAQIACNENALPQGAPCSPVLSNLVAQILDFRLIKIAKASGCTYSRYADDLTFSTNKRDFPAEIAFPGEAVGETHIWRPGTKLREAIEGSGFTINDAKTHMMYRNSRQAVTGLVVNRKISVRKEYRHNVRAMVNRLVTTGAFEVLASVKTDAGTSLQPRAGTLDELHGMLGFIHSVAEETRNKSVPLSDKRTSAANVYREFLYYKTFYACDRPIIVCEGDTDNVYLTHAIRSLAADFPTLAEVNGDGKLQLKVRLYKVKKSSNAKLLGLAGGSGDLKNLIAAYDKEVKHFKGPGLQHPVIALFDNDSGADDIWKVIKQVGKQTPTKAEPLVRVVKNLYAVPTPGKPSMIEDFFDDQTKQMPFEGKVFHAELGFDKEVHISKQIFAHRVIRPNADTIDFLGFRLLLTNLELAIRSHNASEVTE
jgi:RNA-directed DNA polymerase